MMQLNAKQSFFIVVSGYLLGSLTLLSNSWVGGIYIIYTRAATLVRQLPDLPDRLLRPCLRQFRYVTCGPTFFTSVALAGNPA